MRMTDLINDGYVAYIGLDSLSDGMVGSAIGSLLIAELTSIAGDRYNYGVNNKPVSVFIDEAAEVMNDPFVQLLNKGRGARLMVTVATQSFADFAARTGSKDKATQVLANLNNLIALRVLDADTQTYITESLPKIRLQTVMRTQASSTQSDNPLLYSGNAGERLIEEEGELLPPALLGHLPNLEYIGRLAGGRTIKGRSADPGGPACDARRNRSGAMPLPSICAGSSPLAADATQSSWLWAPRSPSRCWSWSSSCSRHWCRPTGRIAFAIRRSAGSVPRWVSTTAEAIFATAQAWYGAPVSRHRTGRRQLRPAAAGRGQPSVIRLNSASSQGTRSGPGSKRTPGYRLVFALHGRTAPGRAAGLVAVPRLCPGRGDRRRIAAPAHPPVRLRLSEPAGAPVRGAGHALARLAGRRAGLFAPLPIPPLAVPALAIVLAAALSLLLTQTQKRL